MYKAIMKRRLYIVFILSLSIGVLEVIGGILSNSIALISDSIHVFTDSIAIALTIFAFRLTLKPHTIKLTYGYHRVEILAAFVHGIILLIIAGYIIIESYNRFLTIQTININSLLTIASIGLIANLVMLILLNREKQNLNVKGAFLHILSDTLSSIGVIIAGILIYYTNLPIIDPIVAIIISILIIRSTIVLLKESTHILLEGVPKEIDLKELEYDIMKIEGVSSIHDLHLWCITKDMLALSAHVVVKDQMISNSNIIISKIREGMLKYGISHVTIQIEAEDRIREIRRLDNDKE